MITTTDSTTTNIKTLLVPWLISILQLGFLLTSLIFVNNKCVNNAYVYTCNKTDFDNCSRYCLTIEMLQFSFFFILFTFQVFGVLYNVARGSGCIKKLFFGFYYGALSIFLLGTSTFLFISTSNKVLFYIELAGIILTILLILLVVSTRRNYGNNYSVSYF